MIIMAIDLGQKRTGTALCDKDENIAYPYELFTQSSWHKLAEEICRHVGKTQAELIVLGLPKNMDGSLGESSANAVRFSEILKNKLLEKNINIDVILWDERQTTLIASYYLRLGGVKQKKAKQSIDNASATVILQNYLCYRKKLKLS